MAFASLGAGMVSAEGCDEQTVDLEELGILEVSMSEDGVIDALIVKEAFFAFMNMDEADLPAIESVTMSVSLGEDGELVLSDVDINMGENQPDEVAVTLLLSDELLDMLHSEDVDLSDLLGEIGMEDVDEDVLDDYEEDYYNSRLHWADEAYQLRGCQDDYDRVMEADDPQYEYYVIYEEMVHDWEEDDESDEEDWNESDEEDWEDYPEDSDEDWNESDEEDWEDYPDVYDTDRERCVRGMLRGVYTVNDDGNGTIRGLVMDEDGAVIGNMWGVFNTDGFAHGFGGADNLTDAQWKAVYEDGRFTGLWKMIDENNSMNGLLKGHYEVNETGDGGVFHGKWKELDCRDFRDDMERPDIGDTGPRHSPIRVDAERIDDVRQLDKAPTADKKLMDKLGDVMDKPLVEDEDGGAIVDVGAAAAGSTLGTIALLGAGFIRRRVTGGI